MKHMRKYALALCLLMIGIAGNGAPARRTNRNATPQAIHPSISLSPEGAALIKSSIGKYEAFDRAYAYAKRVADEALSRPIDVPWPKDAAGGYTHEQHKNNYYAMYYCGIMYQTTGDERYAKYVSDMLKQYAAMYPKLPIHPYVRSSTPGKLFWQTLNENVWLVHTAMAYDCVYDYMTPQDRKLVEKDLFRRVADFVENGTPEVRKNYEVFNMMHNHATWATCAVGMIGYVMGDTTLVRHALYGSKMDGTGGYLRQLDQLFSPDGYFTEGAYYLRYAIWPFMLFAQTIEMKQPELKIFERRDGILMKAMNTLIQEAYDGQILMMNDALVKTYATQEIVAALDIAYWAGRNPRLLSIAARQDNFSLSAAGIATAQALADGLAQPFEYSSVLLRDGADGTQGGVALMRTENDALLLMKATSHGLSHGHYDKLTLTFYDNHHEILTDYGAARFLNIESKSGGRYTEENDSYAMQTVAHNTLVVDRTSHFGGDYATSMVHASTINYADLADAKCQVVSATDSGAYADKKVIMHRTTAFITDSIMEFPFIIDIMKAESPEPHVYDLPFHYAGHLINSNFDCQRAATALTPMQGGQGYEHLWMESQTTLSPGNASFTWLNDNRFYSVTTTVKSDATAFMTRIGANDPNRNLRSEPAVIFRQEGQANHVFASVIEPHGLYDLQLELTRDADPQTAQVEVAYDGDDYTAVRLSARNGRSMMIIVVNRGFGPGLRHALRIGTQTYSWTGNYTIIK